MKFTNSLRLSRFILRRDRVRIAFWIIGIVGFSVFCAVLLSEMYSSDMERIIMAETMQNPAMVAMMGPVFGSDNYTNGAMFCNMMLAWTAIVVAVMNIFHVVRHTRSDEEDGRVEVIRSLPVGRLSDLSATMNVAFLLNLTIALVTGMSLAALGIESMDLGGSMLYGAALGVTGIIFAALAAVFCQLSSGSRGATNLSFIFLGILYLLRAAGDMQSEALSLISPLGLIQRTEAYVNNYWWPVIAALAITAALMLLAFHLCGIRDMGTGLLPARSGRSHASPMLKGPGGLALRLLRTSIIVWTATIFILAAAYGSIFGDMESFIAGNELLSSIISADSGLSYTEQFATFLMAIMAMVSTIPILSFMLRARSQEKTGFAENVLTKAVSRGRQLGAYFSIAFVSTFVMQFLTAFGFWSVGSIVMEEAISFGTFFQAAFAYLPAMWVMLGVAMLLIAYLPGKTVLAWLYFGYSFLTMYLGSFAQFPEWAQKISPYGHVPKIPVEEMNAAALIALSGIAAVMVALGFIGYRKRDMQFN